ncbi:tyrosine-type recombinase/integrase [Streptococcus sp. H31]|uniref:tyrosine-type recombinase/integrase n=1 Tax=Streptococcus huangxiaojuni TaxID=3237239 RepID=UPI0034A11C4E
MWSERNKNGTLRFVERYKDPYTGKTKRVYEVVDKDTPQVRNKVARILQEKINAKLQKQPNVTNITFGELLTEFMDSWSQGVRESTVYTAKNINKIIQTKIPEDYLVQNIDRRFLQSIINDLIKQGRSHNFTSKVKVKLNQIMKYALRMGYIETNEMLYVEMPRKIITKRDLEKNKTKYLDQTEFKLLIQNLKEEALCDHRIEKYIKIAKVLFLTGMRYGELAGLNYKEDIDFTNQTIHIKHTYNFHQKARTEPKTVKSDRIISVSESVLLLIQEQIAINIRNGFDNDYIFINTIGKPITPDRVIKILKKYGEKAGIEKNITTHIFRHSHISLLVEIGTPLPVIMDRVGHSDSKTTLEIYSHVTEQMTNDVIHKLNKITF